MGLLRSLGDADRVVGYGLMPVGTGIAEGLIVALFQVLVDIDRV